MKLSKRIIALIVLMGLLLLTACASNNADSTKAVSQQSESLGRDFTVDMKTLDTSKYAEVIKKPINIVSPPQWVKTPVKAKELYKNSTDIFMCTVENVSFVNVSGNPHTKIDVVINKSLKGDLWENDKVTVIQLGGYITLQDQLEFFPNTRYDNMSKEEKENTIIGERFAEDLYPEKREKFIYCTTKTTDFSKQPTYSLYSDYYCRFKLNDKGKYERNYFVQERKDSVLDSDGGISEQEFEQELDKLK